MAIIFTFGSINLLNWNFYLAQQVDSTLYIDQPMIPLRDDLLIDEQAFVAPTYGDYFDQPIFLGLDEFLWTAAGNDFEIVPSGVDGVIEQVTGTVEAFYEYSVDPFDPNLLYLNWFIEGMSIDLTDLIAASQTEWTTDDQYLISLMFAGDDEFYLSTGDDVVQAHAGNDFVYGDSGNDLLFGNAGDDEVIGGLGDDDIHGGTGNDFLQGGFGSDAVYGGAGDDILFGSLLYDNADYNQDPNFAQAIADDALLSVDVLFGGAGNDFYLIDDQANDPFIFEEADEGLDTVMSGLSVYYMPQNIEYYVNDGINFDGFSDNGTIVIGNDLGNLIKTSSLLAETVEDFINLNDSTYVSDEFFYGEAGNDTLRSGAGNDYLDGGTGDDLLEAGDGDDTLFGGDGNDVLIDGRGTDTIDGGAGTDTLRRELSADYTDFSFTAVIDLVAGRFYSVGFPEPYDTIISIENVEMLGTFDHQIIGTAGANRLTSAFGNDTLDGGGGVDTLAGGAGNDLYITDGGDTITEGLSAGTDTVRSSATHTLGSNLENLELTGTSVINGTGNTLANRLTGNTAANILNGGAGNDTLIGGVGKDLLTGGTGIDQFVFRTASESSASATSADVITDFVRGTDKINLSAIDAFASSGINDAFVWRATSAFSSTTAGEVRYQRYDNTGTTNDYTMVFIDTDADTGVEMSIRVNGLHTFASSDFIL